MCVLYGLSCALSLWPCNVQLVTYYNRDNFVFVIVFIVYRRRYEVRQESSKMHGTTHKASKEKNEGILRTTSGLKGGRRPVTRRIGERGSSWSGRVRAQSAQRASDTSGRQ